MTEHVETLRWMVGIDARELSRGAIAFGRWLASTAANEVFGAHVVQWIPDLFGHDASRPEQVRAKADQALREIVDDPCFVELGALLAQSPEDGLIEALASKRAQALVIGRRAPSDGSGLVRLGRVARFLVRRLPSPVVVVPPDLRQDHLGRGPVMVATDLTESSGEAVRWAGRLATATERPLVLVHAIHPPDRGPYVPADVWDQAVTRLRARSDGFEAWAQAHGQGQAERLVVEGAPVSVLPRTAQDRDACVLVTGSRGLHGVERLFMSSLGTELAASAPLPIAIVAPNE